MENQQELENLRSDVARLRQDLRSLIESAKGKGTNLVEHLRMQARERMERLRGLMEGLAARGRKTALRVQSRMERRPWMTLGIALLAGAILGRLLLFRRR